MKKTNERREVMAITKEMQERWSKQLREIAQELMNDARTIELPDSEFDALLKLDTFQRLFVLYDNEAIKVGWTTFIRAKKGGNQ